MTMARKEQIDDAIFKPRRAWWWDVGVPLVTWLVIGLFFVMPKSMRVIPCFLLFAPAALGSLRSKWWIGAIRSLAKTKRFCVDKDAQMPEKPCILGIHPHGKYPMSIFPTFESRLDLFGKNFVMAQSSLDKFIPTIGWTTILCGNVIDATRKQISRALGSGKKMGLMPGGADKMVHCQPFSEGLPLVKHTGFLRLARRLATEEDPTCLKTPCVVVPCFVFGLHDSFMNPLVAIDAKLYKNTGMNIPLWLPTNSKDGFGIRMVIGKAIDPCEFESLEDFANTHFNALEDLFETHKSRFAGYKQRRLEWIVPAESNNNKKLNPNQRNVSGYVFRTKCKFGFLLAFSVNFLLRGELVRLSTSQIYAFHHRPALSLHLVGSLMWALTSGVLTIKGFTPYHRILGYVALLAMTTVCGSAHHLTMATWVEALLEEDFAYHFGFHSFSNIFVAGASQIQLGFAVAAACAKERKLHARSMGILHKTMLMSFLPRVLAQFIRWLSPLNGVEAHSFAALIQYGLTFWKLYNLNDLKIRKMLGLCIWMGILLSMAFLLVEYHTDFCMIRLLSLVHPLSALVFGFALFSFLKKKVL